MMSHVGFLAAFIVVLLAPGYALSRALFVRGSVTTIERLGLSFALSVAVVPLLAFYVDMLGIKASRWSVLAVAVALSLVTTLFTWHRRGQRSLGTWDAEG